MTDITLVDGSTHTLREGDHFHWTYKVGKGHDYWAKSCIASCFTYGDRLVLSDTFWSSNNEILLADKCDFEFIGNVNDFDPMSSRNIFVYYDDKDCMDLSHSNRSGLFYLRKGAKRSKVKIAERIKYRLEDENYKLDNIQKEIERLKTLELAIEYDNCDLDKFWGL